MREKRTPLQIADVLIWVGGDALLIWDRRRKQEKKVPFSLEDTQKIPYIPKFHILWENPAYYQTELRKALGRGKFRILLSVPEDVTFIEKTALEDFIYAAMGRRLKRRRGLAVCSHSVLLGRPKGQYIAATRTCRCYCIALVKDGEIIDSELIDAFRSDRGALDWSVHDLAVKAKSSRLKVYYPESEEDWTLINLGVNVPFSRIATMDKPSPKTEDASEEEK